MIRLVILLTFLIGSSLNAQYYGEWIQLDSLKYPVWRPSFVVFENGDVLCGNGQSDSSSFIEKFHLDSNLWSEESAMLGYETSSVLKLLPNGEVISIGGGEDRSCEIYNVTQNSWRKTDSLISTRNYGHTITVLDDGRILVCGGKNRDSGTYRSLDSCEIYDSLLDKWNSVSSMNYDKQFHSAVLLDDGRVLVTGGGSNTGDAFSCEIYDPVNDTWTITGSLNYSRAYHASIKLFDGSVLIIGGQSTLQCELFDVGNETFSIVGPISEPRTEHSAFRLNDENLLLILGNGAGTTYTPSWEIYDANNYVSLHTEDFPAVLEIGSNAAQLLDGRVFVAGGVEFDVNGSLPVKWPSKRTYVFDLQVSVMDVLEIPKSFMICQNHPNPFNPTTKIIYSIPNQSFVTLKVFDVLGREITTLVNKEQPQGNYKVEFEATNLTSGIYFYRIQAGDFVETKKMVLMK